MADVKGRLAGRPSPAEPLGEQEWEPTTAPLSRGIGLVLPGRGELDATAAFEQGSEVEDEPDPPNPLPTARHRNAY